MIKNQERENLGVFDVDYEKIDRVALKSNILKEKHIKYDSRVPVQGHPFIHKVSTISKTEKEHRKQTY